MARDNKGKHKPQLQHSNPQSHAYGEGERLSMEGLVVRSIMAEKQYAYHGWSKWIVSSDGDFYYRARQTPAGNWEYVIRESVSHILRNGVGTPSLLMDQYAQGATSWLPGPVHSHPALEFFDENGVAPTAAGPGDAMKPSWTANLHAGLLAPEGYPRSRGGAIGGMKLLEYRPAGENLQ